MRQTLTSIFNELWPMLLIFSVILISIRIYYLKETKERFVFYKDVFIYLFIIYILALFYVVTFQDVTWSTSNFIPFKEMFRYAFGSPLFFRNVIGNMLMFLPYGFFISTFLSIKKPKIIIFLTFIASTTIEVTQLIIGRVFDVDDIILNLLGGIMGYFLYRFSFFLHSKLPEQLKKEPFYNILVIVLIVLFVFFFKNIILVEM